MEVQDSANANLTIKVTADANGKPTAEDVEVDKPTKITWELDDSVKDQWDLVAIQWKPAEGVDASSEFDDWEGSGKNNGKKIKSKDKYTTKAAFPYWIWVVPADGTGAPIQSADPVIRNVPPRAPL
jgi:hypothetical protein